MSTERNMENSDMKEKKGVTTLIFEILNYE